MIFHIIKEAAVNADGLIATGAFHMKMIVMPARKTVERAFSHTAAVETRNGTLGDESVKSSVNSRLGDGVAFGSESSDYLVS